MASSNGAQAAAAAAPGKGPGASNPAKAASAAAQASDQQQSFRPLNVKDALSYLDRVKVTFNDQPEVYDRFLTIMKEFKSQGIDTPGVIERVSSLFRGHPALIQGFNTFLPPGYRIECSVSTPQDDGSVTTITVTTPLGMTTKTQLSAAGATPPVPAPTSAPAPQAASRSGASAIASAAPGRAPASTGKGQDSHLHLQSLPPAPASFSSGQTGNTPIATPGAASLLSNHMASNLAGPGAAAGPAAGTAAQAAAGAADAQGARPPMEFNHAINYVNKIKNRFVKDPETYKAFLEILQTYQKEGRAIQDVYAQVTQLFHGAPDLLDEFKQFLPDTSGEAGQAAPPTMAQSSSGRTLKRPSAPATKYEPVVAKKPKTTKPKVEEKGKQQTKRTTKPEPKKADVYPEPPQQAPVEPMAYPGAPPAMPPYAQTYPAPSYPAPQTVMPVSYAYEPPPPPPPPQPLLPLKPLAPAVDIAFFRRVEAHANDQATYHEFLKLLNLFTQGIIDLTALVNRAHLFLGQDPALWQEFRELVGWTDGTALGDPGHRIEVVDGVRIIENVPSLDGSRRGPGDDGKVYRTCGPSYRQLAPGEISLNCSGRDALCWEVLNDEWVSQPSWASDEGFVAHRKNAFEEAMHRSEEERHEYDYNIEANLRTIALVEPIATRIAIMDADERATFRLKPGLGAQSKSIYQRVIKKVYGKEQGLEVIQALHENPCVAVPIVLARLKQKDDEWKRALREWNRVWRESDAKNFWKSLDHQGVALKANDKKLLTARSLVTDIEMIRRSQRLRNLGLGLSVPIHAQLVYDFSDRDVLFDATKLVLSYLDRSYVVAQADKDKVDGFLRSFLPLVFAITPTEFALEMMPVADDAESVEGLSDAGTSVVDDMTEVSSIVGSIAGTSRRGASKKAASDLRKKALKNAGGPGRKGEGRKGKGAAASSAASSRAESPAPSTDATATPAPGTAGDAGMASEMPTVTSLASLITPEVEAEIAANRDTDTQSAAGGDTSREPSVVGDGEAPQSPMLGVTAEDTPDASANETASENGTPAPQAAPVAMPDVVVPADDRPAHIDVRRQWNMFANSNLYVLVRLFQTLYSRLMMLKNSAVAIAQPPPPQPITAKNVPSLSLSLTIQQSLPGATPSPVAQQLYQRALGLCEKLFDNEIDQNAFEDAMRQMFAIQGYMLFTVDKILTGILKQCQTAISEMRTRDLLDLLRQDRAHPDRSTAQQQTFYRTQAESVLGSDENLYRIEWVPDRKMLSIQLLGKDVLAAEDLTTAEREWAQYIEHYVLGDPTPGVSLEPGPLPYLRRNVRKTSPGGTDDFPVNLVVRSGLQSKICMRSYKMFFVEDTEDELVRHGVAMPAESDVARVRAAKVVKVEQYVQKRMDELQPLYEEKEEKRRKQAEERERQVADKAAKRAAAAAAKEAEDKDREHKDKAPGVATSDASAAAQDDKAQTAEEQMSVDAKVEDVAAATESAATTAVSPTEPVVEQSLAEQAAPAPAPTPATAPAPAVDAIAQPVQEPAASTTPVADATTTSAPATAPAEDVKMSDA